MKRFLVTGATSGVGREVALALCALGGHVAAIGRNVDRLAALGREAPIVTLLLDLEQAEGEQITAAVRNLAPFDGIFHAAGAELVQPLRLTSDEQFHGAMTFAGSSFAILRAATQRAVMNEGGSIVLMSSVAAARGTPGLGAYSAARAAVEALGRVAAVELATRHIRVNCVAAGAFESAMHWRLMKRLPEAAQVAYAAKHPLGFGLVAEIREAALFLLGDDSRWSTGSVMVVDGGFLAA